MCMYYNMYVLILYKSNDEPAHNETNSLRVLVCETIVDSISQTLTVHKSDDDELEDVYANEPLADENWLAQNEEKEKRNKNSKRNYALDMPFSLFGLLLHPKTMHLSGISFLSTEAKIVLN